MNTDDTNIKTVIVDVPVEVEVEVAPVMEKEDPLLNKTKKQLVKMLRKSTKEFNTGVNPNIHDDIVKSLQEKITNIMEVNKDLQEQIVVLEVHSNTPPPATDPLSQVQITELLQQLHKKTHELEEVKKLGLEIDRTRCIHIDDLEKQKVDWTNQLKITQDAMIKNVIVYTQQLSKAETDIINLIRRNN